MAIDSQRPDRVLLAEVAIRLGRGAVVVYPTETFYAIGAHTFRPEAHQRIFDIKGRPGSKGLPLILADRDQLESVCSVIPETLTLLADRFWPGPLTLVVPAREDLPGAFRAVRTVAVRVSALELARELARATGAPLIATSANRSGEPAARTASEVETTLGRDIDLLLDGGPTPGGQPSTIVDLTGASPVFVREGCIPRSVVLEVLETGPGGI